MTNRLPPRYPDRPGYRKLWRLVDGAIKSALDAHPDYVVATKADTLRNSIAKRVVGRLQSSAAARPAGDRTEGP